MADANLPREPEGTRGEVKAEGASLIRWREIKEAFTWYDYKANRAEAKEEVQARVGQAMSRLHEEVEKALTAKLANRKIGGVTVFKWSTSETDAEVGRQAMKEVVEILTSLGMKPITIWRKDGSDHVTVTLEEIRSAANKIGRP